MKSKLHGEMAIRSGIKCSDFDSWTRSNSVTSVSIVFASGSLGNPATYYGHTLLKFNFSTTDTHTTLMDESVNYGAILEGTDDNQLTYLFKSLTGGYDAGFSHINFYFHDHNYGDRELRDLWEYKLDLSQNEVDMIVAHSWEVLGKHYTYYFFKGNCAYQMGRVLEVISDLSIVPDDRPWTIPQSLVQKLSTAKFHGHPLVMEVKYHPSRQSRFYSKYISLTEKEEQIFKTFVREESGRDIEGLQRISTASKQKILDTVMDYYRYAYNPLDDAAPEVKLKYSTALSMRYELPPGTASVEEYIPESPDNGRPPGWFQIGAGWVDTLGGSVSLQVRPAYYDALDAGSGHIRNGALSMGNVRAEIFQDKVRIDSLDLIHIENVNPAISQLPRDKGTAWGLKIGAEQARIWCEDCLVARVQGDIGISRQFSQKIFAAVYMGGALQNERAGQGYGFGRGKVILITDPVPSVRVRLGYEYRFPMGADGSNYSVVNASARWAIDSRIDLRIQYAFDQEKQLNLGLGFYW